MDTDRRRPALEGSWEWLEFAAQLPAKPMPLPVGGASGVVASGRFILTGGNFQNTATAAGTVTIYDGGGTNGLYVAQLTIPASGNLPYAGPSKGLLLEIGCFAQLSAPGITGSLYLIPLWHYGNTPPGT